MKNRIKMSAELRKRAEAVLLEDAIAALDENGATVGRIELNDITERKQAEETLRESQQDFRNLADSGQALIWTASTDKSCNYFNRVWLEFTGRTLEQERGIGWTEGVHPDDMQRCVDIYIGAFDRREKFSMEYRLRHHDGEYRWILDDGCPRHDSKGEFIGYIGHCLDITSRKRVEEEIRQNESRLRKMVEILQHPSETIQDFLDYVLEQAIQLTESKIGYIYHYHEERKELVLNSWSKDVLPACAVANPQTCYALEKTGIWGEAVRQRRPLLVNDFQAESPLKKGYPEGHVHLSRFVTIPIFKGERIVSVVGLANKETDYDETDVLQISLLMDAVWKVTDNMQADEAIRKSEARNREQEVIRISEERFREVLENSIDASYKRNLQTESYDYLSPIFANISGYTPEEIMTLPTETVLGFIHPDDLPAIGQILAGSMSGSTEIPHHLEYRFKHKDGQYRWFHDRFTVLRDESGPPVACIGSVGDITDRKLVEEALRNQHWRLMNIIEGTRVGTWEWNIQTGEIIFNERWAQMIGYSLADLPSVSIKTWEMFAHPDDLQQSSLLLERHFSGELPYYDYECRMKHKGGHWIWVHDRGCVFTRTKDGKPLMMFGTHLDITERKRAEEELTIIHGQLERRVLERTADLEKTNATLAMMLDYARKTETDIQERLVANLRSNIMGIVDALKKQQLEKSTQDLVELLETTTLNLSNPIARNLESQLLKLSTREIQLANYIRLGKSTKELEGMLNLSKRTIDFHRNNLRKKLGLSNKKINLRTFLNSEFAK